MSTPLRGELSVSSTHKGDAVKPVPSDFLGVMSHVQRLSMSSIDPDSRRMVPRISYSPTTELPSIAVQHIGGAVGLSLSQSDVSRSEFLVMPYLIHLAASKNDVEGIQYCLDTFEATAQNADQPTNEGVPNVHWFMGVGGGIVNALDPCGRAPLHTAALHGSKDCVKALLSGGASVHLRDSLDHTPLYYVGTLAILLFPSSRFYRLSVNGLLASWSCWRVQVPS